MFGFFRKRKEKKDLLARKVKINEVADRCRKLIEMLPVDKQTAWIDALEDITGRDDLKLINIFNFDLIITVDIHIGCCAKWGYLCHCADCKDEDEDEDCDCEDEDCRYCNYCY